MPADIKFTFPEVLWAGTEHSLQLAVEAHQALMAGVYDTQPTQEEEVPYLFSQQGDVGVISIRGSLVNRDSPYMRYTGNTSYADIRRALVHAATADVGAIMLDIESGGGAVSGVADTADLISAIDKGVKPVYSYTDGTMASAAYWLGSSAREVHTSRTALMGSIGVITTHMEMSKMLKEAGVGVTVMRAGEYKALANQYEPLSKAGMEQIQAQLNSAYGVFIGHVAAHRGVTVDVADKTMGQGREFFGKDAHTAGLADSVTTFDALMGKIQKAVLDTNAKREQTRFSFQRDNQMKTALTPEQVAAIAAGAPAAQVGAAAPAASESATPAAEIAPAPAAEAAPATPAAESAPAAAAPAGNDAVVALLQSQLDAANAKVLSLTVDAAAQKVKLDAALAAQAGLFAIAAASLSNMRVALGQSAIDASKFTADALLAEHAAVSATFADKFKVGGVAAVAEKATDAAPDPRVQRLVQANRLPARK